jgi:glycine/D-amino acid oxidase-like deaminating enzyme
MPMDGHANPLKLLRALHAACRHHGVHFAHGNRVTRVNRVADGFEIETFAPQRSAARRVPASA